MENRGSVWLYVYDLSEGMLEELVGFLRLNFQQRQIWHSSIVIYGKEIEYGPYGIRIKNVGSENIEPVRRHYLGETVMRKYALLDYLKHLEADNFKGSNYNLMTHNCNTFTNFLSKRLVNKPVPEYLTSLPIDMFVDVTASLVSYALKKLNK